MRISLKTSEEWFRCDRRGAIILTIGVPILFLSLLVLKLKIGPDMDWRDVWLPPLCISWLPPIAWGQAYLARRINTRRASAKTS